MPVKYEKLFMLMKDKGLTTYHIRKESIISQSVLQSLRTGRGVTIDTIAALCKALDCHPGDIMEYTPEDPTDPPKESRLKMPLCGYCSYFLYINPLLLWLVDRGFIFV